MNLRFAAVVTVAMVGAAVLAGGCVSQGRYDEVYASNQRANDQLKKAVEDLHKVRLECTTLTREITLLQRQLQAEKDKNATLMDRLAALQDRLRDLNERYASLLGNQSAPPEVITMVLPDELDEQLRDLVSKYRDLFDYDATKGVLRFKSDMTFAKGSDDVTPRAKEALTQFARIMADPAAAPYHVYIAGHTDDIPIRRGGPTAERHPTNWYLSVHRAVAVQEALVKAGVADKRIGAMGFGEWHPIAPNAPGKGGNEKNRRVELWIVPPSRFLTTDDQAAPSRAPARAPARNADPAPAPAEWPYDDED